MGVEESLNAMEASNIKNKSLPNKFVIFVAILGTNMITYYIVSTGGDVANYSNSMQHSQHDYGLQNAEYYHPQQFIDNTFNRNLYGVGARSDRFLMSSPFLELTNQLNQTQLELISTQNALTRVQKELRESMEQHEDMYREMSRAIELIRGAIIGGKLNMLSSPPLSNDDQNVNDGVSVSATDVMWAEWQRVAKSDENLVGELQEFVAARKLPLGWSTGLAADTLISPIGHACAFHRDDLQRYMEYDVGGQCPDDQDLAQRLLLHGCEPLPRRRCFARSPKNFTEPYPFPKSLWTVPPNSNIHWAAYTCKSFECLNGRNNRGMSGDCLDCFELSGREKGRWVGGRGNAIDFTINEVLALKNGTIRVGLDIGGGTASFAVRMKEYDVTIITTTMNFDGPFNNMIALRGMVPLYISIAQRLPFFDNTLDLVHSMHVLSNWIPTHTLEFLLFDIDRILRPGGLFWLDRFFCRKHELTQVYVPLIEKLGYKKVKWGVGNKLDRGADKQEVYLSALLEKPHARFHSS